MLLHVIAVKVLFVDQNNVGAIIYYVQKYFVLLKFGVRSGTREFCLIHESFYEPFKVKHYARWHENSADIFQYGFLNNFHKNIVICTKEKVI